MAAFVHRTKLPSHTTKSFSCSVQPSCLAELLGQQVQHCRGRGVKLLICKEWLTNSLLSQKTPTLCLAFPVRSAVRVLVWLLLPRETQLPFLLTRFTATHASAFAASFLPSPLPFFLPTIVHPSFSLSSHPVAPSLYIFICCARRQTPSHPLKLSHNGCQFQQGNVYQVSP